MQRGLLIAPSGGFLLSRQLDARSRRLAVVKKSGWLNGNRHHLAFRAARRRPIISVSRRRRSEPRSRCKPARDTPLRASIFHSRRLPGETETQGSVRGAVIYAPHYMRSARGQQRVHSMRDLEREPREDLVRCFSRVAFPPGKIALDPLTTSARVRFC